MKRYPAPANGWFRGQGPFIGMTMPLLAFVVVTVLVPVALFLWRAVDNRLLHDTFPATRAALADWKPADGAPSEPAFAALATDLAGAQAAGTVGQVAGRINQSVPGSRTQIVKTARLAPALPPSGTRGALLAEVPGWADPAIWVLIASEGGRLTSGFLLASLDLERRVDGSVGWVGPNAAVHLAVLWRTVSISLTVTALCVLLALPVAHVIHAAPPRLATIMIGLVLLPLWTSLLVRTVAWIILLQGDGPVNLMLQGLGLTDRPLSMIFTRGSLLVAMVQVLLPLMILPVLSVLRRTPAHYMRAAISLGATWWQAWRRVQLPLILPGILNGSGIVFVFALGYYITPALIGGPRDQMLSSFIVFYTDKTLNWGLAAALSIQLLLLLAGAAVLIVGLRRFSVGRLT